MYVEENKTIIIKSITWAILMLKLDKNEFYRVESTSNLVGCAVEISGSNRMCVFQSGFDGWMKRTHPQIHRDTRHALCNDWRETKNRDAKLMWARARSFARPDIGACNKRTKRHMQIMINSLIHHYLIEFRDRSTL